ncbi:TPA: hypothetical protein ACQVJ1_004500, partial [Serratia marcescens]
NDFKETLFQELAMSGYDEKSKEQVAEFFAHIEENKEHFKDKGTFLSSYLKILEYAHLERYLTDLAEYNLTGVIAVQLLNTSFYDLTDVADFNSVVNEYIVIGDEENTADYFDGMLTNDPFQKFCLYEMHFGRNHCQLTRHGTLVFDNDQYNECSCFDTGFWDENQHEFDKFALNRKLNENLAEKQRKIRPAKI